MACKVPARSPANPCRQERASPFPQPSKDLAQTSMARKAWATCLSSHPSHGDHPCLNEILDAKVFCKLSSVWPLVFIHEASSVLPGWPARGWQGTPRLRQWDLPLTRLTVPGLRHLLSSDLPDSGHSRGCLDICLRPSSAVKHRGNETLSPTTEGTRQRGIGFLAAGVPTSTLFRLRFKLTKNRKGWARLWVIRSLGKVGRSRWGQSRGGGRGGAHGTDRWHLPWTVLQTLARGLQ